MQLYSFEFSTSSFAGWQFPEFHTSIPFIRPGRHRYIQLASYVYMCAACACMYIIYILFHRVHYIQLHIHINIRTFKEEKYHFHSTIFMSCLMFKNHHRNISLDRIAGGSWWWEARMSVHNKLRWVKFGWFPRVKIGSSDSEGYLFLRKKNGEMIPWFWNKFEDPLSVNIRWGVAEEEGLDERFAKRGDVGKDRLDRLDMVDVCWCK